MSLLMDALKKAELAKRQGQAGGGNSSGAEIQTGLELEPLTGNSAAEPDAAERAASAENLPDLPPHLEELEAQFLADAKKAATARLKAPSPAAPLRDPLAEQPGAADTASRDSAAVKARPTATEQSAPRQAAAQNLFAAKQADKPPARKSFAIAVGALTVLSVCGVGGYFWWQLQPQPLAVASRAPLPPPAAPAPTLAAASVAPLSAAVAVPQPAVPPAKDKTEDSPAAGANAPAPVRRVIAGPAPSEADGLLRVSKAPLGVNPALLRGFDAFNQGDLALAQLEYERAQKSDPRNTDALHGLAAIALRQGRPEQAEWLYRQIVEADPQDTVAMAALINSRGQLDPGAAESRLKSLSAVQPELAAPHFALGNLYARHGRWTEAQQAYFRAHSAEPDNPDILYNLAISLEHLRQNKLAAQYYSQAIAAAQGRPAGFDKAQAAARLQTLQH